MGLAGGDNRRNIEAIALLALFLSFSSFSFYNLVTKPVACFPGDIGSPKCPVSFPGKIPLGTWYNFPSSCPSNDSCELFFNSTNRAHLFNNQGLLVGYSITLSVSCITPSSTIGANLQVQVAQFTSAGGGGNTTNFGSVIGALVYVDGVTQPSCPGDLISSTAIVLSTLNIGSGGYLFRVIGQAGGGPGDNPRFGRIAINVGIQTARLLTGRGSSITTSSFTAGITSLYQLPTSTSVTFQWVAMNVTAVSCINLAACIQHGSGACTIAANGNGCGSTINFSPAFSAVPNVLVNPTSVPTLITLSLGALPIFDIQTLGA